MNPAAAPASADEAALRPAAESPAPVDSPRWALVSALTVAALLATAYALTLRPGVSDGDAADLQYMSALLGVCHPPGYRLEVLCGWLFSRLPLGGDVAWRVNLLMLVAGVAGAVLLHGAVYRVTGRVLPAVTAALLLGFSSVYWAFAVEAEAYVFYAAFLIAAVYATVRFFQEDASRWLVVAALALGVAIADRPSELFVLPAFVLAWVLGRNRARLTARRVLLAVACGAVPFLLTFGLHLWRYDPATPYARDDFAGQRYLGRVDVQPDDLSAKLAAAARYCLGLKWTSGAGLSAESAREDVVAWARLVGGLELGSGMHVNDVSEASPQFPGVSLGPIGALLALLGLGALRRRPAEIALGAGLFAGNFAFYLWHHPWDNLTFTIPGFVGLCLLAGIGAADSPRGRWPRWRQASCLLGLVSALGLAVANFAVVDRNRPADREWVRRVSEGFPKAPLPQDAVLLSSYWHAATLRYAFHVLADRTDLRILDATGKRWPEIAEKTLAEGRRTFILGGLISEASREKLKKQTDEAIWRYAGLVELRQPRRGRALEGAE